MAGLHKNITPEPMLRGTDENHRIFSFGVVRKKTEAINSSTGYPLRYKYEIAFFVELACAIIAILAC
jgi:hypothetical protein